MALFEGYERRIKQITPFLAKYGISSLEEAEKVCLEKGVDVRKIVKEIQPISFENAGWAYLVGAAAAIKKGQKAAADIAETLGEGLQAFCIPGSVADDRQVGIGHGNLASMLLREETKCFAFCAGHESFAAAEGAIGLAKSANKARKVPLRVILNGLGKDAAHIIARVNGFTHVATAFDYKTGKVSVAKEKAYSKGDRAASAATARMTCAKASPSCIWKASMSPSREIPPTRPVSSIRSWVFTRKNVSRPERNSSPWPPAAEREEHCIPTTWQPVPPPTA